MGCWISPRGLECAGGIMMHVDSMNSLGWFLSREARFDLESCLILPGDSMRLLE